MMKGAETDPAAMTMAVGQKTEKKAKLITVFSQTAASASPTG